MDENGYLFLKVCVKELFKYKEHQVSFRFRLVLENSYVAIFTEYHAFAALLGLYCSLKVVTYPV